FAGMPQISNEPVARMQRLVVSNNTEAKLMNINRYEDNAAVPVIDRAQFPQFLPMNQLTASVKLNSDSNESSLHSTGFNISPCLMVTNHHAVFSQTLDSTQSTELKVSISAGIKADGKFAGQTKSSHVELKGARTEQGMGDWAVVKSPACLGKAFGWYNPSKKSARELFESKAEVFVVSFPGDREQGALEVGFGNVTGFNNKSGTLEYNASTAPGSSGGAVFVMEDGEMRFVGIHKGGQHADKAYTFKTHSKQYSNTFVPAEQFMDLKEVQQIIALDKQYNGSVNKAEQYLKAAPQKTASKSSGRLTI
ncbi:MAG: serine protease, partial [Proteobacteria bacterium]